MTEELSEEAREQLKQRQEFIAKAMAAKTNEQKMLECLQAIQAQTQELLEIARKFAHGAIWNDTAAAAPKSPAQSAGKMFSGKSRSK